MSWLSRLTRLFSPGRVDRDLDEEQRFHLDARIDDLIRGGLTPERAETEALRQFGGRLRQREASRDIKLLPWLDSLVRDLRHGARLMRKDAIVTTAAILSLALAIGACTAAFSLIDALILRPLPVRDPGSLVYLGRTGKTEDLRSTLFSYPYLERFGAAAPSTVNVFSMSHQSLRQAMLPGSGGQEEKLRVQFVSGNAMKVLGIASALGRLLEPADDVTPGAHPVAVISHAFWTRRLGGDRGALGRWIQVEQRPFQVVGVAQAGFTGAEPGMLTDVWITNMMWVEPRAFSNPDWNWLRVWGRLAPGVDRAAAAPILQTTFSNARRELDPPSAPKDGPRAEDALELRSAANGTSQLREDFERPLLILSVLVGLVLLIACSNMANLLLARGAARDREMMLRASLGAGRARLLQQVLVEGAMLTLVAVGVGLVFARAAVPLIVGMLTKSDNPVHLETAIDLRVVAFVAALGAITTLLFSLAPALRASRVTPNGVLSLGSSRHTAHSIVLRPLIALQIGFSLMVLFVASLLLQSFDRLSRVDLGFTTDNLLLATIETRERLAPAQSHAVGQQLLDAVRRVPGVQAASLSSWGLFKGWSNGGTLQIPGGGMLQTQTLSVSPGFCTAMGIRLIDGREFEPRDIDGHGSLPRAVIVNEAFARKYFPGESIVGRRLERQSSGTTATLEVIGIVRNVRDNAVRGAVGPYVFLPMAEPDGALEVRTSMDPRTLEGRLRELLPRVHPSLRVTDVTPQSSLVGNAMLRERLLAVLSGFFAGVGLALAAVGLYGVSSYAVVRRTREIGIRLALGARPGIVIRSVLGGTAIAAAIGAACGLGGGLFFSRFVRTLLFETEPLDLWSVALPAACLLFVVIIATGGPARRATRVDPVAALRAE